MDSEIIALRERVFNGEIAHIKNLEQLCGKDTDPYDDILGPIGHNTCDRCGKIEPSEDLFWVDGFDYEEDSPEETRLMNKTNENGYGALCWECVDELKERREK